MHRFLWFIVLMLVLRESPTARADEMQFYYFPIDVETYVPVTRETIRKTECQGVIEDLSANALRAFVSKPLTRATESFEEKVVRILVKGPDIEMALDQSRHMQVDMKRVRQHTR